MYSLCVRKAADSVCMRACVCVRAHPAIWDGQTTRNCAPQLFCQSKAYRVKEHVLHDSPHDISNQKCHSFHWGQRTHRRICTTALDKHEATKLSARQTVRRILEWENMCINNIIEPRRSFFRRSESHRTWHRLRARLPASHSIDFLKYYIEFFMNGSHIIRMQLPRILEKSLYLHGNWAVASWDGHHNAAYHGNLIRTPLL